MSTSLRAPKEVADRQYRLLPSVFEHIAKTTPDRIYAAAPKSPSLADGVREVSFAQVLKAADAFANLLETTMSTSSCFETLTYVGVDDLRYVVFLFACIKTGYKALFVSPRSTAIQNAILNSIAKCQHLYYAGELAAVAESFDKAAEGLKIHEMRPFDHWLSIDSKPMPFTKTYEEAKDDPVLCCTHQDPLLITQIHQWLINNQKEYEGRPVVGMTPYNFQDGGYFLGVFPFFHLAGFFLSCVYPTYSHSAAILLRPASRPPTPELLWELMRICRVRTLAVPPSIIEALAKMPGGMEQLAGLDYIHFAGGPLEKSCGDRLSKTVMVCNSFGATETGHILTYLPSSEDWEYFEFHKAHNVFLEEDVDGMSELVLYRDNSGECNRPIDGTILRTEPMWRSKDLFINDPQRPHLWRYCGRKDDIIVFSTGQKWNPVPTEGLIRTGTKSIDVFISGTGRTEPALFIETSQHNEDHDSLLNQAWPVVEDANSKTQRYGRISRSHVAFVKPGTFLRTGKGTIIRKTTVDLLKDTLDRLYDEDAINGTAGKLNGEEDDHRCKQPLPDNLTEIVRQCVHQVSTVSGCNDEEDLFVRGLDSLEAAEIARSLKTALHLFATAKALKFLTGSFVFQNPTIVSLTDASRAGLTGGSSTARKQVTFDSLFAKYQATLASIESTHAPGSKKLARVAMTGSTGSLGSQILKLLQKNSQVSEIICLNRSKSALSSSGRNDDASKGKTSCMTVNFAKPDLGLASGDIDRLSGFDAIVHCAWEVNFNRSLATFETQISALVDLIKVSLSGAKCTHLVFISSMSAVDEKSPEAIRQVAAPETLVTEPEDTIRMGYAVSKNLAEHLLSTAAERYGLHTTVIRVGQIGGSTKASDPAWNRKEWLPSLIDTSANLGCLPVDQPEVDWVPVDSCAQVIMDMVGHDITSPDFKLYNVVNPQRSPWKPLAMTIQSRLESRLQKPCEPVTLSQWVEKLKLHDDGQDGSLRKYPGLKLLPFFETSSMNVEAGRNVSTTKACMASETLARLSPVGEEQMKIWMTQWGYRAPHD